MQPKSREISKKNIIRIELIPESKRNSLHLDLEPVPEDRLSILLFSTAHYGMDKTIEETGLFFIN